MSAVYTDEANKELILWSMSGGSTVTLAEQEVQYEEPGRGLYGFREPYPASSQLILVCPQSLIYSQTLENSFFVGVTIPETFMNLRAGTTWAGTTVASCYPYLHPVLFAALAGQETFEASLRIEELLSLLESEGVLIREPEEIEKYLLNHADITDLLPSICKTTSKKFAGTAQLSLEIYRDPEFDDESLLLLVRQSPYYENILETIDSVSDEYADDLNQISGSFRVTTDFRLPR